MKRWVFGFLALAAISCGGSSPSTPTVTSPTSITVNSASDLMLVGNEETFTATANAGTLSAPRWGSDAVGVATVDSATGRVTAVGIGTATIFVDASGLRGSKLIRTLQNFAGTWSGTYVITGCQSSADFTAIGFCELFPQGEVLNLGLGLSQNRDSVTGGLTLGSLPGTFTTGTVAGSGLAITGTVAGGSLVVTLEMRFESSTNGVITGSFDEIWSSGSASGTGRLSASIRSMTRTSAQTSGLTAEGRRIGTLAEMVAALRR